MAVPPEGLPRSVAAPRNRPHRAGVRVVGSRRKPLDLARPAFLPISIRACQNRTWAWPGMVHAFRRNKRLPSRSLSDDAGDVVLRAGCRARPRFGRRQPLEYPRRCAAVASSADPQASSMCLTWADFTNPIKTDELRRRAGGRIADGRRNPGDQAINSSRPWARLVVRQVDHEPRSALPYSTLGDASVAKAALVCTRHIPARATAPENAPGPIGQTEDLLGRNHDGHPALQSRLQLGQFSLRSIASGSATCRSWCCSGRARPASRAVLAQSVGPGAISFAFDPRAACSDSSLDA